MADAVTDGSIVLKRSTFIEHANRKFLIMDSPSNENLHVYLDMLKKRNVVAVVRACEPEYSVDLLEQEGISVLDVPFTDGDPPPSDVVNKFLDLIENSFSIEKDPEHKACIAVHCVAGLGRSPVLVAIALIEAGMEPYDAISFIRKKRRGAINARQLAYLEKYKKRGSASPGGCCVIQ